MSTTASLVKKVVGFPHTRIGVVGSREFPNRSMCESIISSILESWHVLVSGGARGVDQWAETIATERGIQVCSHRADWNGRGRTAGILRNTTIVRDSDVIVAFWDGKSKGTLDTINKAKALNKVVCVVLPDGRVLSNYGKVAT